MDLTTNCHFIYNGTATNDETKKQQALKQEIDTYPVKEYVNIAQPIADFVKAIDKTEVTRVSALFYFYYST